MFLGNMVKISDMIIRKGVSVTDAIRLFSFSMLYLSKFTIPLSFLLGVLISMGRLITDNELVPIRMAGISTTKILHIFLLIGIIFSLILFILNATVIPNFHYNYRTLMKNIFTKNVSAIIEPGVPLDNFPGYLLYASDKNENKLKNVYIYEIDDKKNTNKVIFAKTAEFITEGNILKMKLENGFRDEADINKSKGFQRLNFKIFFKDLPIEQKQEVKVAKKNCDMGFNELRNKIKSLKSPPADMVGEFHERISFSLSIIAFIILGFSISLVVRHREKSINFGIAFLGGLSYYLLFIVSKAFVEHRLLAPAIGMWLPNIIICGIGLILLKKNAHFR